MINIQVKGNSIVQRKVVPWSRVCMIPKKIIYYRHSHLECSIRVKQAHIRIITSGQAQFRFPKPENSGFSPTVTAGIAVYVYTAREIVIILGLVS